jgi:hypothetical protein
MHGSRTVLQILIWVGRILVFSVEQCDKKLSSQRKLPAQIEQAKDKFYDVLPLLCKQTSDVFLRKFSLAYVRLSALTPIKG